MTENSEHIGELIQTNRELQEFYLKRQADIDKRIIAKEKEVDRAILELANSHAQVIISYYDNTRHSQASLAAPIDPDDDTKTEWVAAPTTSAGYRMYPSEGNLTKVHTTYCLRTIPGHYNKPPYSVDTSSTAIQFCLANIAAKSAQINQRLDDTAQSPQDTGAWWDGARIYDAASVRVPGLHPYSRLFVRFVNIGHKGPAQNVIEFGGNASFSVERVVNYPHIRS